MGDYLEAALRRMLGRGAQAAGSACADEDRIAAYLESSLADHERRLFEEHASACGRCQEILGLAMRLTDTKGEVRPGAVGVRDHEEKVLFNISIPLSAAAAAAVLVITGAVVIFMVLDSDRGPEQISAVSTAPAAEQAQPLPYQMEGPSAPAAGVRPAPQGAGPADTRTKSVALPAHPTARGAGRAAAAGSPAASAPDMQAPRVKAAPIAEASREETAGRLAEAPSGAVITGLKPSEAGFSRGKADEFSREALVIRALVAQAAGRDRTAAPAAGQAAQRMLPEQAEVVVRSDFRASEKITIKGRTFHDRGAYWVDDECAAMPGAEIIEIRPATKEYREILASYPEIRVLLGHGKSVVLCWNGRICVLR